MQNEWLKLNLFKTIFPIGSTVRLEKWENNSDIISLSHYIGQLAIIVKYNEGFYLWDNSYYPPSISIEFDNGTELDVNEREISVL